MAYSICTHLLFRNLKAGYPKVFLVPRGENIWLAYYRGLKFHISTPNPMLLRNISEPYERYFQASGIAVDVGASIGEQTLPYALRAERVFVIEPGEVRASYLLRNVWMNDLTNVNVIEKAVWSDKEILEMGKGKIEAEALRDLIPMEVDFLKIDVEGAELEVLKGADLDSVKNVVLETHGTEREVTKLLGDMGFEVLVEDEYVYAKELPSAYSITPIWCLWSV